MESFDSYKAATEFLDERGLEKIRIMKEGSIRKEKWEGDSLALVTVHPSGVTSGRGRFTTVAIIGGKET